MRRLRVTASMKRHLANLRDLEDNPRRGGVMHLPRILLCDEWESLASAQQDALIAASYEDRDQQTNLQLAIGPEPSDGSHLYKA